MGQLHVEQHDVRAEFSRGTESSGSVRRLADDVETIDGQQSPSERPERRMVIDHEQPRVHDSTVRRVTAVGYGATPVIGLHDSLADAGGRGMRVVVADDAVLFREGLARLLAVAEFEVSAQVGNAQALLERVREDPPDMAVVDIRMPPAHTTEGLEAARALRASHPAVGILVLSAHVEAHVALQLIEDGVRGAGYLLEERVTDLGELTDAVRRVAAGGLVIDPSVVARIVARKRVHNRLDDLSDRERDVLAVMAEGRSNQAISERLYLSPKTVEAYVRGVFTKPGLHPGADDNRRVLAVPAFLGR